MDCPVCATPNATPYNLGSADASRVDCKRCGEFDISRTAMAMLPTALQEGLHRPALMSHTIRRMSGYGKTRPPMIVSDKLESYWSGDKLPPPGRQADELIMLAGDQQQSPDEGTRLSGYFLGAWLGTSLLSGGTHTGLEWILDYLREERLVNFSRSANPDPRDVVFTIQLTMRGWERYAELKRVQVNSRTAFMAMKFGDAQLNQVVDDCFRPAVKRTGFELKKLTDEQPAGLIDDQIRAALLSGRFVIADLTHGSHGAYWEAGFAEGLRLPVIYTCEATAWKEKQTHFDTNHMLTIIWDANELKKAGDMLTATIRATLRAEANQQD
jgi:hypothetical protein